MKYTNLLICLVTAGLSLQTGYILSAAASSSSSSSSSVVGAAQTPVSLHNQALLNTQLYKACCRTSPFATVEEVAKLYEAGANITMTEHGLTPLYEAAIKGNSAVTKYLLEKGARITQHYGVTLLHLCSDPAITELLLAAGADPRGHSMTGFSELELAITAYHSPKKIIQLLSYGADMHHKNTHRTFSYGIPNEYYNHTPLDVAFRVLLNRISSLQRLEGSVEEAQRKLRSRSVSAVDKAYLQNLLDTLNNTVSTIKVLLCNGAPSTNVSSDIADSLSEDDTQDEVTDLMFDPEIVLDLQGETISRVSLYIKGGTVILDPISPTISRASMTEQLGNKSEFFLAVARICRGLMELRHQHNGHYAAVHATPSDSKEGKEAKK